MAWRETPNGCQDDLYFIVHDGLYVRAYVKPYSSKSDPIYCEIASIEAAKRACVEDYDKVLGHDKGK